VKFVAPKLMRPAKFGSGGFQHSPRERAFIQVLPKAFPGQFLQANRSRSGSGSAKTIAIQHSKTVRFPALPLFGFAPEADRES
jgi:hypothetical protein